MKNLTLVIALLIGQTSMASNLAKLVATDDISVRANTNKTPLSFVTEVNDAGQILSADVCEIVHEAEAFDRLIKKGSEFKSFGITTDKYVSNRFEELKSLIDDLGGDSSKINSEEEALNELAALGAKENKSLAKPNFISRIQIKSTKTNKIYEIVCTTQYLTSNQLLNSSLFSPENSRIVIKKEIEL